MSCDLDNPGDCRNCQQWASIVKSATAERDDLRNTVAELRARLAKANANHEDFERRWYLADDEADRLRALVEETCEIAEKHITNDNSALTDESLDRLDAIRDEAKGAK